ncbi:MAG: GspH/FimT family pseudopilin [Betaproteobacteria bacterium]
MRSLFHVSPLPIGYSRLCRSHGFTLIEVLFAIVILGVLLSLAAPSMRNLVLDQRVKTVVSDMHATLIFARSEAIKRNQYVAVCAMNNDGSGCQNSTDWARGWIVYLDADGNGIPGAVSDILKRQDALHDVTLTGTGTNITYQKDGRLRAAATTFVTSYAGNNDITARCVRMDISGRPNIQVDTNKNSADGCQ